MYMYQQTHPHITKPNHLIVENASATNIANSKLGPRLNVIMNITRAATTTASSAIEC